MEFDRPEYYLNRELSWLKFNERVLNEAMVESNPLLEQLNFIAIAASNMDEFFAVLQKTPYARHYNFEQDLTIEQMYEDCLYHLYTADRRQNPYSIASINMYLFLKEEELRKLTTAMECIRYGLNSGETLGYVGGKI